MVLAKRRDIWFDPLFDFPSLFDSGVEGKDGRVKRGWGKVDKRGEMRN